MSDKDDNLTVESPSPSATTDLIPTNEHSIDEQTNAAATGQVEISDHSGTNVETSTTAEILTIENNSNVIISSENMNNENREKELSQRSVSDRLESEGDNNGNSDNDNSNDDLISDAEKDKTMESDNRNNENIENENSSNSNTVKNEDESQYGDYAAHVTYNEYGQAIYTDPVTKFQYKWSKDENQWVPLLAGASTGQKTDSESDKISSSNPQTNNPYENEHYRWCLDKEEWVPKSIEDKNTINSLSNTKETEFYRWCDDTQKWIPKTQSIDGYVYDFEDGVRTYIDKDGVKFFWDVEKKAWFPKIDDDFMAQYQMNYGFIDNTTGNAEPTVSNCTDNNTLSVEPQANNNTTTTTQDTGIKRKLPPEPPKWFELDQEQNTKVYVSNLPLDITEEEYIEIMSKCGLIVRDAQTQKYKIKLYTDASGKLKGDGLCDYIRVESVQLALNVLDGSDVRGAKIKVQRAQFQMRGEYDPSLKPKKKKKDKEKMKKMQEKLFDWRPEKMRGERSKNEKTVIIKNLFTPELFDNEVHLILEYQNDLREECLKCGAVKRVVLYDRHPDGIAQVTMSDPEEADLVIRLMNGRFFGTRQLSADTWDGKTKYKIDETQAEVNDRLTNWDKYLETDETTTNINNKNNINNKIVTNDEEEIVTNKQINVE